MKFSRSLQEHWKSLYFLVAKTGFKGLIFLYTILVAKHLPASSFSDFQLLIGLVNILVQPSMVLGLFVSRSGWEAGDTYGHQISRLKSIYNSTMLYVLLASIVVGILLSSLFPVFSHFFAINSLSAYLTCVAIVLAFFLMNYFLGFAQATEDFHVMGTTYLLVGVAILVVTGFVLFFSEASLEIVLITQLFGYCLGAGFLWSRCRTLFSSATALSNIKFKKPSYYVALTLCLVLFFLCYYMDIYVVKSVMDEESTNSYIQIVFIAKIAFIVSSTLGAIVFPKASKAAEKGKSAREYFFIGMAVFLFLSIMSAIVLYFASNDLLQLIFKVQFDEAEELFLLLVIVLSASVVQAVVFFLIHYSMAKLVKWPAWLMLVLFCFQLLLNVYDHSTPAVVATNSLVPGLIGIVVFLVFIFLYRNKQNQSLEDI